MTTKFSQQYVRTRLIAPQKCKYEYLRPQTIEEEEYKKEGLNKLYVMLKFMEHGRDAQDVTLSLEDFQFLTEEPSFS